MALTASADLQITSDGLPKATIVIRADAEQKVKDAANDLQYYIEKISGVSLPLVPDTGYVDGTLILVGDSRYAKEMEIQIPKGVTNSRREEGFVIVCAGDRLLLAGNDDGPYHGTEYAVYEFLRRIGVRWFMPGEYGEIIPTLRTIAVPQINIIEKPDFIMRDWWLHITPELKDQERRWKIRNKMNPDQMFATPSDSTTRNVLPEAIYFKEHPEYFAKNPDGTYNPYLPSITNLETVTVCADTIKTYFRDNPTANSYGFAPDDGMVRDYSPQAVSLNQGFLDFSGRPNVQSELSVSEEWFGFVNKVAKEVRRELPEIYIATNGYANRNVPPQGIELDDHLVIMYAAIWSCTLHAYDDKHCWQKMRQAQSLKRWSELSKNVWIYGYNTQMLVSALTLLPETRKMRRDFPLMKKWGVIGFLDEARNVWAECGIASRYLRAHLEWNADADAEVILDDFYKKWYGNAAKSMRDFYEAIEDAIEKASVHAHEDRVLPEIYTPTVIALLGKYIAIAEENIGDDSCRVHVRAERLIYEHLLAYYAMNDAERKACFADAARYAERMLEVRKELHAINPFYIWFDETRYHSGVYYWGVEERRKYYLQLADLIGGVSGDLVAILPEMASFRADPYDDGLPGEWYKPDFDVKGWDLISTSRPYYVQGYQDSEGHQEVGNLWYRYSVDVPTSAEGRGIILYAPVLETEGWCWVNGVYIGHRGYREAFERPVQMEFDVTKAIRPGVRNTIVVRVNTSLARTQGTGGIVSRLFMYAPK